MNVFGRIAGIATAWKQASTERNVSLESLLSDMQHGSEIEVQGIHVYRSTVSGWTVRRQLFCRHLPDAVHTLNTLIRTASRGAK